MTHYLTPLMTNKNLLEDLRHDFTCPECQICLKKFKGVIKYRNNPYFKWRIKREPIIKMNWNEQFRIDCEENKIRPEDINRYRLEHLEEFAKNLLIRNGLDPDEYRLTEYWVNEYLNLRGSLEENVRYH